MKRIFSGVTDMKRVLILNGEGAALENIAIRSVLEYFGYIVTMYNIGRPQDYFDVFGGKLYFNYDYLIIGCHGDGGKIIVPVLGENVYYPNECRNNIGYEELQGSVKIKEKPLYAPDAPQVPEIYAQRLIEITISLLLLRIILKATAVCCLL